MKSKKRVVPYIILSMVLSDKIIWKNWNDGRTQRFVTIPILLFAAVNCRFGNSLEFIYLIINFPKCFTHKT